MEWLVVLLATVAGVEGWFWKESTEEVKALKAEIGEMEERGRINVTIGELEKVDKRIKLEIPIAGKYVLDTKRDSLPSELNVMRDFRAEFDWSFVVHLGYDFNGWVWCEPEKDDEAGLLSVEIPPVTFLDLNSPDIKHKITPYIEILDADSKAINFAQEYGKQLIEAEIAERGAAYQDSSVIIKTVNDAMAKSLQDQLNAMQVGHNPISKLTVINRKTSSCADSAISEPESETALGSTPETSETESQPI